MEAIDLLYAGNTFDMLNPRSIALLADTVLPRRLNQVRVIHILGSFSPFQAHEWDRCWSILSTMQHLIHLRVLLWDEPDLIISMFEEEMSRLASLERNTSPEVGDYHFMEGYWD